MEREQIVAVLLKALEHATMRHIDPQTVTENQDLRADLGLDSLGLIETVWAIEEQLAITIPEDQLKSIVKVGDVFRAIELAVAAKK